MKSPAGAPSAVPGSSGNADGSMLCIELAPDPSSRLIGLRPVPAPAPAIASYKAVLKNLIQQPLRRNTIFVTSMHAGEGTTTTAANLAGLLSRDSESVLLVELRLTAPRLLHLLGDPTDVHGLESGLRGRVPLSRCIFSAAGSRLCMIAARNAMTEKEALQQSGALNDFLEWAEARFEWVILDCPPVSSPEWTRWFELNADPVVLVVRAGSSRSRGLQRVARHLQDRLAGAILNDVLTA